MIFISASIMSRVAASPEDHLINKDPQPGTRVRWIWSLIDLHTLSVALLRRSVRLIGVDEVERVIRSKLCFCNFFDFIVAIITYSSLFSFRPCRRWWIWTFSLSLRLSRKTPYRISRSLYNSGLASTPVPSACIDRKQQLIVMTSWGNENTHCMKSRCMAKWGWDDSRRTSEKSGMSKPRIYFSILVKRSPPRPHGSFSSSEFHERLVSYLGICFPRIPAISFVTLTGATSL